MPLGIIAIYVMGVFVVSAILGFWGIDLNPLQITVVCLFWPLFVLYYVFYFAGR